MRAGQWMRTSATIGIDNNGRLRDGHHRLLAVIKSGVPQHFLVARGLSPDSFSVIETGAPRSFTDSAKYGESRLSWLNKDHTAIARALIMIYCPWPSKLQLNNSFMRDFVLSYEEPIKFGCSNILNKVKDTTRLGVAKIGAAIAVAYLNENHEKVLSFANTYIRGPSEKTGNLTPLVFRDFVLMTTKATGKRDPNMEVNYRAQAMIKAYCEGREIKRCLKADAPTYELTGINEICEINFIACSRS
jgi:hypothetical protein